MVKSAHRCRLNRTVRRLVVMICQAQRLPLAAQPAELLRLAAMADLESRHAVLVKGELLARLMPVAHITFVLDTDPVMLT